MDNIIVFDMGGTWMRSGLYRPQSHSLSELRKVRLDWHMTDPQEKAGYLVDAIVGAARDIGFPHTATRISVSLGACMNHITGEIYGSAPIFGNRSVHINLKELLISHLPEAEVEVINDVTALCYGYDCLGYCANLSQIAALTLSSGIALRRYDARAKRVFYDGSFGIQGEIGHMPMFNPFWQDQNLPVCDCGKTSHFSAFSSGNGILHSLQKQGVHAGLSNLKDVYKLYEHDAESLNRVLDRIAYPIAQAIAVLFCMCPDSEKLFISGGVIECLGSKLIDRIYTHLEGVSYLYDSSFYQQRLVFMEQDVNLGLLGAGFYSTLTSRPAV